MSEKERRKIKYKLIINLISIFIIAMLIVYLEIRIHEEKSSEEKTNFYETTKTILKETNVTKKDETQAKEIKQYPKEYIEETYKGYKVISKLEIPKIDLETNIIKYSETALNISATKFWGCNPNEVGNFCIAAHNFKKNNMFHNLKELDIGDTFWIKDNVIGCIEYVIYDIYTVFPNDTKCLSQNTNGVKEVTLITCTNNSKKRIIVKAKEILI